MEAMRNSWTDERLDDGFDRVTADIAVLRGEVASVRTQLKTEIGSVRKEIGSVRTELKAEIGFVRTELEAEIGSVRTELKAEIGSLRSELKNEIGLAREETQVLRRELHQAIFSLQRTLFHAAVGIIVALAGIIATQL
jgi:uncharacterized protein involved in exopolysaccharide biosynthesis